MDASETVPVYRQVWRNLDSYFIFRADYVPVRHLEDILRAFDRHVSHPRIHHQISHGGLSSIVLPVPIDLEVSPPWWAPPEISEISEISERRATVVFRRV